MREIRYALRVLRRSPGFAAVAVLSLAFGIGANTAIFSASWALFSQPLAVADPDTLVAIGTHVTTPRGMPHVWGINQSSSIDPATGVNYQMSVSYPAYLALRAAVRGSADVCAFTFLRDLNISIDGRAVAGAGALVSGNFFRDIGVPMTLGRALGDDDDYAGTTAAVVSHRFWAAAMGSDPGVVGKTIRLNGAPFIIVGVSAPGFAGMSHGGFFPPADVTIPLRAQPVVSPGWGPPGQSLFVSDRVFWLHPMARVAPAMPAAALEARLAMAFASALRSSPQPQYRDATEVSLHVFAGGRGVDELSRTTKQPLQILTAVVAVVLLLACVNLASLMLARGAARRRELSIRLALGSGSLRLLRQALVESLLLSTAGGILGLFIGTVGARILLTMLLAKEGPNAIVLSLTWRTIAWTAGVASAASVLFGVLPALRLIRREAVSSLKSSGFTAGAPRLTVGRALMAAQIAMSVPLLVGAAMFLRTLYNLNSVDPGFNPAGLVFFQLDPSLNHYDRHRTLQVYAAVLDRVRTIPGVVSVTIVQEPLLNGWTSNTGVTRQDGTKADLYFNEIGPDYFATLGIPLLSGRSIDARDTADAPKVVVLNERAAQTLFGTEAVLGRRFKVVGSTEVEVVGLVKDTKYDSLRKPVVPTMFIPYTQVTGFFASSQYVLVRAAVPPASLEGPLRSAVAAVDPDVPVKDMKTENAQIEETLGTEFAFTRLLVAFGGFALFLAWIGLHGITSYSIARRTAEIGVRMALGAQRSSVLWLVLRQVAQTAAIGLAIGLPIAVASAGTIRAFLFGVAPLDPLSLAIGALLTAVVACAAGYFPALRAARLDPLQALRVE